MEVLCKNLKLAIDREDFEDTGTEEIVRLRLVDDLGMTECEVCYSVSQSHGQSRKYHIKEAIVIGLRRLVDEAMSQEMIRISDSRGEWSRSNIKTSDLLDAFTPTTSKIDVEF